MVLTSNHQIDRLHTADLQLETLADCKLPCLHRNIVIRKEGDYWTRRIWYYGKCAGCGQKIPTLFMTNGIFNMSFCHVMYLKRKHCGTCKAHGCADSRSQCEYITQEKSSLTTVSTYVLFTV